MMTGQRTVETFRVIVRSAFRGRGSIARAPRPSITLLIVGATMPAVHQGQHVLGLFGLHVAVAARAE